MYKTVTTNIMQVKEATKTRINQETDVYELCKDMGTMAQESFQILTMNTSNKVIDRHMITLGIVDASLVHPREVFRAAIMDGASAIILVHNHPSGNPLPSLADIQITKQLIEGSKIIDIPILDHVIIAGNTSLSMRESHTVEF